ncbi:hypothetical protein JXD38_03430 [candidate division WOR-3 bacterium]|nr:hypothetical protein [candidate division WOR-3 bacterium]
MTFEAAVRATTEIAGGYCSGLRGLGGAHRSCVRTKTAQVRWRGSVNLEVQLSPRYRGQPQWDYAVGYGTQGRPDCVAYVEVHPASTHDVDDVIRKKNWLTAWLDSSASSLRRLRVGGFHWVAVGSVRFRAGTPQYAKVAQNGIILGRVATIG